MEVTYLPVPDFPNYRVGNDGSVWSSFPSRRAGAWMKMKPTPNRDGHLRLGIRLPGEKKQTWFFVHRLVLSAFVGPCPDGMEGCHFPDSNPANNHLSNLRWDTKIANYGDRIIHGTDQSGERNGHSKLTDQMREEAVHLYATGQWTQEQIGKRFNVGKTTITMLFIRRNQKLMYRGAA